MKRRFKLVVSWLVILSFLTGFFPGTPFVSSAAASSELIWPNPGAVNLTKSAEPTGTQGKWKVTLKVEGKNIKTSSDVVLVIDRSGSMKESNRMTNARDAAKKFVDNLLIKDSTTKIAVVTFDELSAEVSGFVGVNQKETLKNKIDGITVSSNGTNIQSGLNRAHTLLDSSQAKNKVIVLLSDGAPTYSFKASKAAAHKWPFGNIDFVLSSFNYNKLLGDGRNYELYDGGFFGWGREVYEVNGKTVNNNGIATISEAKIAHDKGISVYSIGLEVGGDSNAVNVLKNAQNKGYYPSNSSELNKVFTEISGQISYAAQNAKVIDPMGEKFNRIGDFTASQGEVRWNAATETFTWEIGSIMEGSPATLSYYVVMDPKSGASPDELYPTNGTTTLTYTDVNGQPGKKDFEVPKVNFGKGSITVKGYHVNAKGEPVNAEGVVVERPELAEQLYSDLFAKDGSTSLKIGDTYSVPAKVVDEYRLQQGADPTSVKLTIAEPSQIVWFGYAKAPYTLKVEHKAGDTVLETEDAGKLKGETLDYSKKTFEGYQFKGVQLSADSGLTVKDGQVTGKMPNKDVTITFNYEATKQQVTVKYLERGTNEVLKTATTAKGKAGETIKLEVPEITGYTVAAGENYDTYTFTLAEGQEHVFYYTKNEVPNPERSVYVQYVDQKTGLEIQNATNETGQIGQVLTAPPIPGYTVVEESSTYTITDSAEQSHIFYYKKNEVPNPERSVYVQYVDQKTDLVIQSATTVTGPIGQVLTAPPIPGYTVVEESSTYTITDGVEQSHIFYYTKNEVPNLERSVYVQYVDQKTDLEIQNATNETGQVGEVLTAPPIEGYTVVEENRTYTITDSVEQSHIFYYTKNEEPGEDRAVFIQYIDEATGEAIKEPTTETGPIGGELTAPFIPGYTAVESSRTYVITDGIEQSHIFYYQKLNPDDIRTVVVKFIDKLTKAFLGQTTFEGIEGQTITIKLDPITTVTGDVYSPETPEQFYTFTGDENQELEVPYIKGELPPVEESTVTVKFLEQGTNNELAVPQTKSGKPGEGLTLAAPAVNGYTPVKATDEYTFGEVNGEYVFYYTKNPVTPPSNPDPTPSNPNPTPSNPSDSSGSGVTPLPPAPPVVPLPPPPPTLEMDKHYNYVNGYPDGTIKPESLISREEVAAIFYRLMDDATRSDYLAKISTYEDVKSSRWSSKHIGTMENAGIITGYLDGTFKPGRQITRAEFAAIASRFDNLDEQENKLFSDINGHWAEKYIVSAANKGWIKGYPDGKFKPNQYITRAEAMAFINSVLNRKVSKDGIHEDAKVWPDNASSKWYYADVIEATNHHEYTRDENEIETWDEIKPDRVYP